MTRVLLTENLIERAFPKDRLYFLRDCKVPGLECVINPSGRKTWFFRAFGQKKKLGILPFLTLEEARTIAIEWYSNALRGISFSVSHRKSHSKNLTVNTLIENYLTFKASGAHGFSANTQKTYRFVWEKYASETIGKQMVSDLMDEDINKLFHDLNDKPSNTHALRKILIPAFKYGSDMGFPVAELHPDQWLVFKKNTKERYFTAGEMNKLNVLVDQSILEPSQEIEEQAEPELSLQTQAIIIKLLMFTGCRVGELLNLKWSDVFIKEGYIQLWKTKTKKGRIVPITPVIECLLNKEKGDSPYVFPALQNHHKGYNYNTLLHFWKDFIKLGRFNVDDVERLTIHSLRHTFITVGNRIGVSPFTLQALVGHSKGRSTTAGYIHSSREELANAQESIIVALQKGAY